MRLSGAAYQELLGGLLEEGQTVLTRVRGVSMTPAVPDGVTARVEPLGDRPVRVGEVVMTRTPRGLLCHRVLRVSPDRTVETWGDVCRTPDAPLPAGAVIGRLVAVEVAGRWQAPASKPGWWRCGRWAKYRLRKLLGIIDREEALACAVAAETGDDDRQKP
jgi:hypothetical protein